MKRNVGFENARGWGLRKLGNMTKQKITAAEIAWDEKNVPRSLRFDDVYYSDDDGLAEVLHTFITPNNFASRFAAQLDKQVFTIVETGFGAGLNFLTVVDVWLARGHDRGQLHFISFEKYPMAAHDLARAQQAYPQFSAISEQLIAGYPRLLPGWHDLWLFDGRVRLTLWFGDVLSGLPELDSSENCRMDAWLLDGFAPKKNPEMWLPPLFQQMARLSHAKTTFATFTSAGDVRRGLASAGFTVQKSSGFGKKREMCYGAVAQSRPFHSKAPWFSRPEPIGEGGDKRAIVIGAGLAGASSAYQLAQAGWKVTVLEAEADVAQLASGNLAGTVHPLITVDWNLRSQWYLLGFEALLRHVKPWLEAESVIGDLQGMVQILVSDTAHKRVKESIERVGLPEAFIRRLSADQACELVGGEVSADSVFYHDSGWLNPRSIVQRCLAHERITLLTGQTVETIEQLESESWRVANAQQTWHAEVLVVATGSLNQSLNKKLGVPIRPVKGQVTHLTTEQQQYPLKFPVTHDGYSSPCAGRGAVTGATFEAPDMSMTVSEQSHQYNIQTAQQALPSWLSADAKTVSGRVAFRPTTPDHLPVIGPVANSDWMDEAYLSQSHTHVVYRYPSQRYQRGLYVSNGHGPRGLMSVFLAAETIVADVMGTAPVMPLSLYHASHPARFEIRTWRSGKKEN